MQLATIWHCLTDSDNGNTYDVYIKSEARPTDEQIVKAMHQHYVGEYSEYINEDIAELELFAISINENIIDINDL